jgi:hypothetical protein
VIVTIPTFANPFYSEVVSLDGQGFLLNFTYNQRCDCWYLSIATTDGIDLLNGVKILSNWPLLKQCADNRLPPGEIVSMSATIDVTPARLADLGPGGRCTLYYVPVEDQSPPYTS